MHNGGQFGRVATDPCFGLNGNMHWDVVNLFGLMMLYYIPKVEADQSEACVASLLVSELWTMVDNGGQ